VISRGAIVAFLVAFAALQFASLANPGEAAAADPPARLQFDAEQRDDGSWMLRATLTRAGAVQSQETVQFLQQVDFFGERWVPIGTAVTDAAGVASWLHSPTSNGVQRLIARYAADDGTLDSDPFDITVSGAAPAIPGEPPVLPVVRAWAFPVGASILFLVWLFLAVILLRAVIGIARQTPLQAITPRPPASGPAESSPQATSSTE
jgi:hypothetical protein